MISDNLSYTPKSCWELYGDDANYASMREVAQRYAAFLTRCKTERETVQYVVERLQAAGFSDDMKSDKVFRLFKGKTLFAAVKGSASMTQGVRLIGAHGDSPRIDLKQHPLYDACGVGQAKTHYYGGIRKYQWLARPLALHGVVVKSDGTAVSISIGEEATEPVFVIADLLPHLARKQGGEKLCDAFDAEKLNIILGHRAADSKKDDATSENSAKNADKNAAKKEDGEGIKQRILQILHEKYGIIEEDLYSAELQAVPAGAARFVGLDENLIGAYGQDDRICVFAALEALLQSPNPTHTQCYLVWDKEEIGSEGSTGAKSRFFEYCIQDCIAAWEPAARFSQVMLATRALSADVHGAMDPDWQELHEKLNSATMGFGPCMCKFTGHGGKYEANDAHPEYVAWIRGILNEAGIPWQMAELGKVDQGGGGTVAMHLAEYGMDIVDFGPAILSMHSPFELASIADVYATMLAYACFYKN